MSINLSKDNKIFKLDTNNTSYVFGVDDKGLLRHIYWGTKIENIEDFYMPVLERSVAAQVTFTDLCAHDFSGTCHFKAFRRCLMSFQFEIG